MSSKEDKMLSSVFGEEYKNPENSSQNIEKEDQNKNSKFSNNNNSNNRKTDDEIAEERADSALNAIFGAPDSSTPLSSAVKRADKKRNEQQSEGQGKELAKYETPSVKPDSTQNNHKPESVEIPTQTYDSSKFAGLIQDDSQNMNDNTSSKSRAMHKKIVKELKPNPAKQEPAAKQQPVTNNQTAGRTTRRAYIVLNETGEIQEITRSYTKVGRELDNDWIVDMKYVSRHHAEIFRSEKTGTIYIEDLKSTNGTFVNQHRINQQVKLNNKDKLRLGDVEFTIQYD